jgi:SAM-dependent methyltransferase
VKKQVDADHYFSRDYDTKERFCSYWHQVDEVFRLNPGHVLEIGVGNGFASDYLRRRKIHLVTIDIDRGLRPDVIGTVLQLPFKGNSFDVVACCEVLEHIPYSLLTDGLSEIHRVCRNSVVLSLPDPCRRFHVGFHIRNSVKLDGSLQLPGVDDSVHHFDGQHYWEIGRACYPLSRIVNDIISAGFSLRRTYRVPENPWHRFLIIDKI